MDLYTAVVAERLNAHRASALEREVEMLRIVAERGTTITPERPVVSPLERIGIWLRGAQRPPRRLSVSH